ncbi:MAG: tripartite tricarboxylate transporter substrate binding protein [Rubritepida sp.]|nr:tripartite tricarboxylate transporter substrate binding protein [Rubritepida sp.]
MFRRGVIACGFAGAARAQDRPVRMVVPSQAGGTTDSFARRVAVRMQPPLGQPVTVVNRPGEGGSIGTLEVIRARPDGQTILLSTASTLCLHGMLTEPPRFDVFADLVPISLLGASPVVFAVRSGGASGLAELLDAARHQSPGLRFGSPGTGTYLHLALEMLRRQAGEPPFAHVPFVGSSLTLAGLLAGQVDAITATVANSLRPHRAGDIHILAVAGARRSPLLPEVPTVAEALSLAEFEAALWMTLMLPAGGPVTMRDRLAYAINSTLSDRSLRVELEQTGFEVGGLLSPAAITGFLRAEQARWRPLLQAVSRARAK